MKRHRPTALAFGVAIWCCAVNVFADEPKKDNTRYSTGTDKRVAATWKKLNEIIIPQIDFINADFAVIFDFLSQESKRHDPEKIGVKFVIIGEPPPERQVRSPKLRDVRLIDLVRVFVDLFDWRFVVEPDRVVLVPRDSDYGKVRLPKTNFQPARPAHRR